MRTNTLAAAFVFSALACTTRSASASPGTTGYSGKPYNGVAETCTTTCHAGGGTPPALNITVPSAMKAGETAEVTIVVDGTRTRTSMNAALSDGVKATKGQNTEIPFPVETPGEVAAVTPPPNGADGTYKFTFVAPNKNGPITLWVAGMSSNGSGSGGDGVATATRTITVSGATPPPPPDGGAPGDDDGGASTNGTSDAGSKSDAAASSDDDDDEGSSSGTRRRSSTSGDDAGGCAAARASTLDAGAIASGALAALALVLSRRRVRRRQ